MASYSKQSMARLLTCHPDLQAVFVEVIKHKDCSILWGYRGEIDQNKFYHNGTSKIKYPDSKHNKTPSLAVDAAPYPIDWTDRERFILFAGFVLGIAESRGIKLRWGGDWSMDGCTKDEKFSDLSHFELII